MAHLEARLIQSGHWDPKQKLTHFSLLELLEDKIKTVNFDLAKRDVEPFLKNKSSIELWSQSFFTELTGKLNSV